MTDSKNDINQAKSKKGSAQFVAAIECAQKIMLDAPWLKRSKNKQLELAAAESQLQHQISIALEQGFALNDPDFPEFRCLNQHNQFGLFNPDNRYHIASITTPGTYVICGKRGSSADLQIQVGGGDTGFDEDETAPIPVSTMDGCDLIQDEDGNFEISISDTDTGGNWMSNVNKDGVRANSILIRESFMDWENEKGGTWYIYKTNTEGKPKPLPTPEYVNAQYQRASNYLIHSTKGWVKFVKQISLKLLNNDGLIDPIETTNGLPGQWNCAGLLDIDENKAIVVTVPVAPARYYSIQVGDQWFNSFDFCNRHINYSMAQASRLGGKPFQFVISQRDPGVPNWLDPVTASKVFIFIRWQGLPDCYSFTERPSAKTVNFEELRNTLPDEPLFTELQRRKQLAKRRAYFLNSPRGF